MRRKLPLFVLFAILMFNCESGGDETVVDVAPQITLAQSEIVIDTSKAASSKLEFTSTLDWKASLSNNGDSKWISVSPTSGGAGKCKVSVVVTENPSTKSRTSSIKLSSGDISKTIGVSQAGADDILLIDSKARSVTCDSGVVKLFIASNSNWRAAESLNWISLSQNQGSGDAELMISYNGNSTYEQRVGEIIISQGDIECTFTLTQAGDVFVDELSISPNYKNVSEVPGAAEINIFSNGEWSATESVDWLSLSQSQGSGDAQLVISYDENCTYEQRVGEIIISQGAVNHTFTLAQAGVAFVDEMTISPSSKSVTEAQGTTTISITSNGDWMATESVDWINLPQISGSGDAEFTISYDENSTYEQRTGEVIILQGDIEHTFTLTQVGDVFVEELSISPYSENVSAWNGSTSFNIYSNGDWSATEDLDWLRLSKNEASGNWRIYVSYDKNTSVEPRSGVINIQQGELKEVFTLTQSGADVTLSLDNYNIYCDHSASIASTNVYCNSTWSATSDSDWLELVVDEGEGDALIEINVLENTSAHSRSGSITFASGDMSQQLTINQSAAPLIFSLDSYSRSVDDNSGSFPLSITTNSDKWSAENYTDWIRINPSSGTSSETITIEYDANSSFEERRGSFYIHSGGEFKLFELTQAPMPAIFSSNKSSLSFGEDEGQATIALTSNANWKAQCNERWIRLSASNGNGATNGVEDITIEVESNPNTEPRSGVIIFNLMSGGWWSDVIATIKVNVEQEAKLIEQLVIEESSLVAPFTESSKSISVTSNCPWRVSSDQAWCKVDPDSGDGNGSFTITLDENTGRATRSATITITTEGLTHTISILQNKANDFTIGDWEIGKDLGGVAE